MLPQNQQQKKVMDSMLKNYSFGKHFGSDAKKQGLMDLMVKHNITTDINSMKGYKKEAFLKDVEKSGLDYYGKKAIRENYGPQSASTQKQQPNKQSSYDEIMAKKRTEQQKVSQFNAGPQKYSLLQALGFRGASRSSSSRDLVKRADNYGAIAADNYNDTKDRLNRIQE